MAQTPEEIIANEALDTGDAPIEVTDFSTEDIASAEDIVSGSDANDAADRREETIELDNDSVDELVNEAQEVSGEGIDDGNDRG